MIVVVRGTGVSDNNSDRILCNIAASAMQRYAKRVLILQTSKDFAIEKTMIGSRLATNAIRAESYSLHDSGMDALMRRIEMGPLTHEQFSDCCQNISKTMNSFDIADIPASDDFANLLVEKIKLFKELLKNADKIYDVVFVHARAKDAELLSALSDIVDKELVCISQGPKEKFELKSDDALLVVDNYDSLSSFTLKLLGKTYGVRRVYPVPYNIGFKDACLKNYAIQFLFTNNKPDESDNNAYFADCTANLVGAVLGMNEPDLKDRMFIFRKNRQR